jgi:MFS family permease
VIRTLVLLELGTGIVFGATEVGVTAAAHALGNTAAAGPVLGLWGAGSLFGGLLAIRMGGSARYGRGLIVLLAALAISHAVLIVTAGSVLALSIGITLAGATIAPTASSIYAMVDVMAPAGSLTEAYSWLLTASLVGASLGMALAGALVQSSGARAAFALVGVAGGVTVLVAWLGSARLPTRRQVGSGVSGEAGCIAA